MEGKFEGILRRMRIKKDVARREEGGRGGPYHGTGKDWGKRERVRQKL